MQLSPGLEKLKETKPLLDATYGDKALSISQINWIIKVVKEGKNTSDQCHSGAIKMKWTSASNAATIENDQEVTVHELAAMDDLPFGTIHAILTDHLDQVKKSSCWVPKLLSTAKKKE